MQSAQVTASRKTVARQMAENRKIKAIVLTWDRNRAITDHMILQYDKIWPDHPFMFRIPYQTLQAAETKRISYVKTPQNIKATALQLIADLPDEEWIYWCMDDRYPIQFNVGKITRLISHALESPKMSGLLFCRCRRLLKRPKQTLFRREWVNPEGDIYYERRGWSQIWIHQLLRAKVLRHLFSHLPDELPNANAMDKLKHQVVKPRDYRLFVTKENFAVFGESTRRGAITQNCYDSMVATDISLPEWFRQTTGEHVTLGVL
jgi:hypothetical protein